MALQRQRGRRRRQSTRRYQTTTQERATITEGDTHGWNRGMGLQKIAVVLFLWHGGLLASKDSVTDYVLRTTFMCTQLLILSFDSHLKAYCVKSI